MNHLWKRKNSKNVNYEMRGQVTFCNLLLVLDKNTSPKNSRRRSDKASTKLENDVNDVKNISERAQNACSYLHFLVNTKTFLGIINDRHVEEQGVKRDSDDTS